MKQRKVHYRILHTKRDKAAFDSLMLCGVRVTHHLNSIPMESFIKQNFRYYKECLACGIYCIYCKYCEATITSVERLEYTEKTPTKYLIHLHTYGDEEPCSIDTSYYYNCWEDITGFINSTRNSIWTPCKVCKNTVSDLEYLNEVEL